MACDDHASARRWNGGLWTDGWEKLFWFGASVLSTRFSALIWRVGVRRARLVSGWEDRLDRDRAGSFLADWRHRGSWVLWSSMGGAYAPAAFRASCLSPKRRGPPAIASIPAWDHLGWCTCYLGRPVYLLSSSTFLPPVPHLPPVCGSCFARSRIADLAFLGHQPYQSRVATATRRQTYWGTINKCSCRWIALKGVTHMNGADLACEIRHVPGIFSWLNLLPVRVGNGERPHRVHSTQSDLRWGSWGRQTNGSGSSSHEPFR